MSEQACPKLQNLNIELEDAKHASSRHLAALCDVVVQVDDDLHFDEPSCQLHHLSMAGSPGSVSELRGRQLTEFLASEEEATRIQHFMSLTSGGVAPAFTMQMKIVAGSPFRVEAFHLRIIGKRHKN